MRTTPVLAAHLRRVGLDPTRATLDDLPWAYETQTFSALGRPFAVRTSDPAFGEFIDQMFFAMRLSDAAVLEKVVMYSVLGPTRRRGTIFRDHDELVWSRDSGTLLERLIWEINQRASRRDPRWVKLHAGAVDRDGTGVVIAGPMESGKSTLTAALVRRGYRYLSDEIAAVRYDDGDIDAYPKPLGLDPGSWPLLPEFAPESSVAETFQPRQWLVSPTRFPAGTSMRVAPAVIIFPAYMEGSGTRLAELSPSAATVTLSTCVFEGERPNVGALKVLARLAASTQTYQLDHDDLAVACDAIDEVVGEIPPRGRPA